MAAANGSMSSSAMGPNEGRPSAIPRPRTNRTASLLYLDHLVHIPRYRVVGWALTAGPVILVATMSGSSLAVTTGLAAGVELLGTAAAGFHDLARLRPARASSPVGLDA
jgi:hypothetical protein